MSKMIPVAGPKYDPLAELDIDELVDRLSPGEIQRLLDECDPDDPNIPPSMRTNYKCEKNSTGPLDRKKLLDYINEQALNTPDVVDPVPYVPGCVRGKKWMAPPKPVPARSSNEETIELDIDFGDEYEMALNTATTDEIVDLAGILGLHSMMNQDQFHSAQSDKWADKPDPSIGWNGITKATPLKQYPAEKPNTTNPSEVISRLKESDAEMKSANLNNVVVSESQFLEMFDALRHNDSLTELSLSNTTLGDFATANLACSLKQNKTLEKLNIESNNISPPTLIKIFEAMNESQTLTEIKASNQQAQFLGNKVEMAITKHIEGNKTIMRVGLHFEFGDCRNRVAVQLQKNLDRIRLKRVANKVKAQQEQKKPTPGSKTGGYLGALPGQLTTIPRQKSTSPDGDDDEYEYYDDEDEEQTR
uniref:Tropomodulin n=1 Tax=Lepeophtheirus salmonis TaxID=72036 RepID=A0A0K2UQS1_LEPSM